MSHHRAVARRSWRLVAAAVAVVIGLGAPAAAADEVPAPPPPTPVVGSVTQSLVKGPSVPLALPAPCVVDLRSVPTSPNVDVGGTTAQLPHLGNGDQFASLFGEMPLPPAGVSTAPVAWGDGGSGSLLDATYPGFSSAGTPYSLADAQVAADEAFMVHAVNARIAMRSLTGGPSVTYDLSTLLGAPPYCTVFDAPWPRLPHPDRWITLQPRVFRDFRSGRWFVSATVLRVRQDGDVEGSVRLAVSQTQDPTAGYAVYTVSLPRASAPTARWAYLQPRFAVTDDKVVFTWHSYTNGGYAGVEVVVLPKAPLLGATPGVGAVYGPDPTRYHVVPSQLLSGGTAAHLATLGANGVLVVEAIDGPPVLGTTTRYEIAVTPWTRPVSLRQRYGTLPAAGGILQTAVVRDGVWWGAATEACMRDGSPGPGSCVRMWQLTLGADGTPALTQEFTVGDPGAGLGYPAAAIDAGGNLAVAMTRSSSSGGPGFVVVGQAKGSPRNTISRPIYARRADARFNLGEVWGSYAGATASPDGKLWFAHQYSTGDSWSTEVVALKPAQFTVWPTPARVAVDPGGTATATLTVASLAGWSGTVALTPEDVPTGSTVVTTPGSVSVPGGGAATATVTINAGVEQAADFVSTVAACDGSRCQRADIRTWVRQFAVDPPGVIYVEPGATATKSATLNSVHGWSGPVTVSVSGLPPTASADVSPRVVTVPEGGSVATNIHVSATEATTGDFSLVIEACASFCRRATVPVRVPQFSMYSPTFSLRLAPGETGTAAIQAVSWQGWTGTVTQSVSGVPAGTTASISPSEVTVPTGSAGTSSLTVTVGPEQTTAFVVRVTGCTTYCRTVDVPVSPPAPTFSVSAPTTLDVPAGGSATATVTVASLHGFSGNVTLVPSGMPSGTSATVSPRTVTVASGGTAAATLTVAVPTQQATSFVVRVTATNTARTLTQWADILVRPQAA